MVIKLQVRKIFTWSTANADVQFVVWQMWTSFDNLFTVTNQPVNHL